MKKIYFIILFVAAAVAAGSCTKGPELPVQILEVSMDAVIATPMGAEYELAVTSNTKWKLVNGSDGWISVDVTENVGSATLTIGVLPNEGDERAAKLTLSSFDNSSVREINVVQPSTLARGFVSVKSVRGLYAGEDKVIRGNAAKIKGFVVTDARKGNWDSGIVIQDSYTEKNSGIVIATDSLSFERGTEVAVALDGATVKKDAKGRLVVVPVAEPYATETTNVVPEPVLITYQDLSRGDYESMYVKIEDFQIAGSYIGSVWSSSPYFEDSKGTLIRLVVSENAVFGVDQCPALSGTVAGIAGPAASLELYPVDAADMELSEMRFGVNPGITTLPYVFSFYCSENTNATPKYLSYSQLTYDPATQMMEGVVARDLDVSTGVFLELAAYGKEVGNIQSSGKTNFWAENGAHDNINASGFLSDPAKEVFEGIAPTKECGFFLTVPVQMSMPSDFNVSFGMAGNSWTKALWAVSYSTDRQTWHEAQKDIFIDHICENGTYYLYYTVPVHLEAPVEAGSTMYIKFTPKEGYVIGKGRDESMNKYSGHGSSTWLRLHSAIVLSQEVEGDTPAPAGALYFEPFDKLTAGMDYFIGDKLAAFANYCADSLATWPEDKKRGLTGTHVHERPGYAQIGFVDTERPADRYSYVNNVGALTTPELGYAGDLLLTFKAAAYRSPAIRSGQNKKVSDIGTPDLRSIVVEVLNGGTINGLTSVRATELPVDSFGSYSYNISGATEKTRIRFTSAAEVDLEGNVVENFYSRWFIDDICVTK